MNQLKMKARAGVTLVELLVVILIVTILSVSMLPLLQPFVVESQYAAEPIPVIGNLRTKIGLYQYDKGKLPGFGVIETSTQAQGQQQATVVKTPYLETWGATVTSASQQGQAATTSIGDPSQSDTFVPAYCTLPSDHSYSYNTLTMFEDGGSALPAVGVKHFSTQIDVDYQELKGKRSKPMHYQYLVLMNGANYAYFVGCFGDGNGLRMGTGYAVCEIQFDGHKYIGTWKRYKAYSTDNQISFTTEAQSVDTDAKHTYGCYVPQTTDFVAGQFNDDGKHSFIGAMETRGWEF